LSSGAALKQNASILDDLNILNNILALVRVALVHLTERLRQDGFSLWMSRSGPVTEIMKVPRLIPTAVPLKFKV